MPVSWVGTSWNTVLPLLGRPETDPAGALPGPVVWGTTTLFPAAVVLGLTALRLTRRDVDHHHTRARVALVVGLLAVPVHLPVAVVVLVVIGAVIVGQHRVSRSAVRALGYAVAATATAALLPSAGRPSWLAPWPVLALAAVLGAALVIAHHRAMPLGAGFRVELPDLSLTAR